MLMYSSWRGMVSDCVSQTSVRLVKVFQMSYIVLTYNVQRGGWECKTNLCHSKVQTKMRTKSFKALSIF